MLIKQNVNNDIRKICLLFNLICTEFLSDTVMLMYGTVTILEDG